MQGVPWQTKTAMSERVAQRCDASTTWCACAVRVEAYPRPPVSTSAASVATGTSRSARTWRKRAQVGAPGLMAVHIALTLFLCTAQHKPHAIVVGVSCTTTAQTEQPLLSGVPAVEVEVDHSGKCSSCFTCRSRSAGAVPWYCAAPAPAPPLPQPGLRYEAALGS